MAQVEFRNVSKRFEHGPQRGEGGQAASSSAAVKALNLTLNDGELMVLVGPSGCGKSTTLRLLAGLEQVSEGEILIDGQCVNQRTPQQRNIAMVFQNYALYPHLSVRGNLEFPLKMAHVSQASRQEKIAEIAVILNLTELLERKPKQLSGGQRQRVAMGRALVRDPSVFLLDEPLSNLDAKLRTQIRADIAQLQKRLHKTTLYVTHDQVEAMTLGNRVAVMNAGELQQCGTPEQIYSRPCNVFVAKFIGSPGMNVVPARLINTDNELAIDIHGQRITLPQPYSLHASLKEYGGQRLFIGFRPEVLHVSAAENDIKFMVQVTAQEFLGHETLLHFQIQRDQLQQTVSNSGRESHIARLPGNMHDLSSESHDIHLDPDSLYWFDADGWLIFPT